MSLANRLSIAMFCASLICFTGCCTGPFACGPNGSSGPVGFGSSCDGCGDCEGCGELYIDPWINDPADCCDPCDRCGNHNGQSCGKCRSVFDGVASLWGYRCGDTGCDSGCDTGCDSCGTTGCGGCGVATPSCGSSCGGCDSCRTGGGLVEYHTEPTPAKQIVEAVPSGEHYRPSRTKKIFRARPSIASGPTSSSDL